MLAWSRIYIGDYTWSLLQCMSTNYISNYLILCFTVIDLISLIVLPIDRVFSTFLMFDLKFKNIID